LNTPDDRPAALITGAVKRVGLAIARELARAWQPSGGCRLIITYRSSEAQARTAEAELRPLGADVQLHRVDFDSPAAADDFAHHLARTLPRLDVLVHNASTYVPTPLASITAEQALAAYRVNALAPLLLSGRLAPLLSRSMLPGGGAIVAMCDIHALGEHGLPRPDFIAYGMSKAALAEMVRSLARELAPRVRVNGVAPGVVAWPEQGHESDPKAQEAYLTRVPLARAGMPEDAACVVRWLALEAAYVTGEIVRVDGGRSLR
jgi:pteridine reductase